MGCIVLYHMHCVITFIYALLTVFGFCVSLCTFSWLAGCRVQGSRRAAPSRDQTAQKSSPLDCHDSGKFIRSDKDSKDR